MIRSQTIYRKLKQPDRKNSIKSTSFSFLTQKKLDLTDYFFHRTKIGATLISSFKVDHSIRLAQRKLNKKNLQIFLDRQNFRIFRIFNFPN